MKKVKHADPMKTRTGKPRLGPLNITQLQELLSKTVKPKIKSQIQRKIQSLEK